MKNPIRIVFVTCSNDPWINDVEDQLIKISRNTGIEIFVLSSQKEENENFINFENISKDVFFEKIKNKSLNIPDVPEYLIKMYKERFPSRDLNRIKNTFRSWMIQARYALKILQPDLLFVWNGLTDVRWVFANEAKNQNIKTYFLEKGFFPGSWYIDPLGIGAKSRQASLNSFHNVTDSEIADFKKRIGFFSERGDSAWEQPKRKITGSLKKELGLKNNQKVIFFPGQVDTDTNIVLFSKIFKTTYHAVQAVCDSIRYHKDYFLLVKPHPKGKLNKEKLEKIVSDCGTVETKINVMDAIEMSDMVITINSTVGYETALNKKPALFLGDSLISNKGIVSQYNPEISLFKQITECIKADNNIEQSYNNALTFGAYIEKHFYAYKDSSDLLRIRLKNLIKTTRARKKIFGKDDLNKIFSTYSDGDITTIFEGRKLFFLAIKKLRTKIKSIWKR